MHAWLRHSGALVSAVVGLPVLAAGVLLRPAWRPGVAQRLGWSGPWDPGSVWVHAASVGESLAALRLFEPLEHRGLRVFASATTPAGREVLATRRPTQGARFAPLDHPWCVDAAMERAAPRALILVETELWPLWIAAAARREVPVFVVSGRLSDRSLPRYQRLGPILRSTWPRLAAIGARSERDAERFLSLGVAPDRVHVTGDLKFDAPSGKVAVSEELDHFLGTHLYWAAISTHPGESAAVLDAFEAARARSGGSRLLLAPRHLGHVPDLERVLAKRGFPYVLRSAVASKVFAPGSVLVLDTLGEAPALLPRAAFVFVGGTLVPVGGHNILEPAWAQRAVLFGPYTSNVAEAAESLLAAGAAIRVADASALRAAVLEACAQPEAFARRGESAQRVVSEHSGAAERSAELVMRGLHTRSELGRTS